MESVGEILQITGFSEGTDEAFADLRQAIEDNSELPKHLAPGGDEKSRVEKPAD